MVKKNKVGWKTEVGNQRSETGNRKPEDLSRTLNFKL